MESVTWPVLIVACHLLLGLNELARLGEPDTTELFSALFVCTMHAVDRKAEVDAYALPLRSCVTSAAGRKRPSYHLYDRHAPSLL